MLAIRRFALAALALALLGLQLTTAAPIPGVKAGGDDGDKWLLDEAEMIMVFNFKQMFDSKLMKSGYTEKMREAMMNNPQAKEMADKLGLDLTKDIDSIIVSGGKQKDTPKGRFVLKGNFDVEKLSKAMKSSDKVKASKEGSIEVFEVEMQGANGYGAFAGKNAFILTESKETTVALAKSAPEKASTLNKDVKAALATFTGKESMAMVMVVTDELKGMAAMNKQVEAAVKSLSTLTASITVEDGITLKLVGNTTDAKSAASLEKQLTGLKAIAEIGLGMAEMVPPVAKEVFESLKIDKTRDSVIVTLPITKDQIEKAAKLAPGG